MAEIATPDLLPGTTTEQETRTESDLEPGYLVICWNDPINEMRYVTHVFQKVFGWPRKKAEFHMLQVHEQGKSILVRESLEKAEHYVHQLQKYSSRYDGTRRVKLLRKTKDSYAFHLATGEKDLLLQVLHLYPLIPAAYQRVSKGDKDESKQRLLDEALMETRIENKRQLQKVLSDPSVWLGMGRAGC